MLRTFLPETHYFSREKCEKNQHWQRQKGEIFSGVGSEFLKRKLRHEEKEKICTRASDWFSRYFREKLWTIHTRKLLLPDSWSRRSRFHIYKDFWKCVHFCQTCYVIYYTSYIKCMVKIKELQAIKHPWQKLLNFSGTIQACVKY